MSKWARLCIIWTAVVRNFLRVSPTPGISSSRPLPPSVAAGRAAIKTYSTDAVLEVHPSWPLLGHGPDPAAPREPHPAPIPPSTLLPDNFSPVSTHPAVAPATIAALIDVPLAALLDLTSARPRCCASHDPAAGAGSGHATRKRDRLHRRGRSRHPGGRGRPCGLRDAAGWERRMNRTVKRAAKGLSIAMAVLLMAGIAAPYLSGNRFAPCIRAALESALGRKVE